MSETVQSSPEGCSDPLDVSIVILTFNRERHLKHLLQDLAANGLDTVQTIVVNNGENDSVEFLNRDFPYVELIQTKENLGVAARNLGFKKARSPYVVTLDDDIYGLTSQAVLRMVRRFERKPRVAAICLRVVEEKSGRTVNWIHRRPVEKTQYLRFLTYEITEGAVAIRKSAVGSDSLYPDEFFISHEGPDLAYRLIKKNYLVEYNGKLALTHTFAKAGRPSWRKFYYDTRNSYWLVARHLPVFYGGKQLLLQTGLMLILAARANMFRWWFKGTLDGLKGLPKQLQSRRPLGPEHMKLLRSIDHKRAGVFSRLYRHIVPPD